MTEERLYTVSEAARELDMKYDTLIHSIIRGKIPVITLPRKPDRKIDYYRITQTTLDTLRNSRELTL